MKQSHTPLVLSKTHTFENKSQAKVLHPLDEIEERTHYIIRKDSSGRVRKEFIWNFD
jgi:hypothetical protein